MQAGEENSPVHIMGYAESLCNLWSLITFTFNYSLLLLLNYLILITFTFIILGCMICIGGVGRAFGGG